jgi:aspartate carbamoyltransferase catalytic subunit
VVTTEGQRGETPVQWRRKDLLGIEDLSREEIELVLDTAVSFQEIAARPIKKVPTLRGKTIANLFVESSTRTRSSFELAAKRLSADLLNISATTSSLTKGETLLDTARNLEAMHVDVIIMRHAVAGAPHRLARCVRASVVNAGDGAHEHPTQALLDLLTIRQKFGRIAGLTVSIVGDIAHSRVARSNIWALTKMGARVIVCGPPTLIPVGVEQFGVEVTHDLREAIRQADILYMLRIQRERQQANLFPSIREYAKLFGVTREKLADAKPGVSILHPGPVNRGVELSPEIADGNQSVILEQVSNGIAVRMAVLYLVCGAQRQAS